MLMLTGLPDIPLSMSHSQESQKERGDIRMKTINRTIITIIPRKPYATDRMALMVHKIYDRIEINERISNNAMFT